MTVGSPIRVGVQQLQPRNKMPPNLDSPSSALRQGSQINDSQEAQIPSKSRSGGRSASPVQKSANNTSHKETRLEGVRVAQEQQKSDTNNTEFTDVQTKRSKEPNANQPQPAAQNTSNRFEVLQEISSSSEEVAEDQPTSKEALAEESPKSTDGEQQDQTPTEEAGTRNIDPAPPVNDLPDLNITPSYREQRIELNRLEKQRKRDKKTRGSRIQEGNGQSEQNLSQSPTMMKARGCKQTETPARMNHDFLWATMRKMGFNSDVIELTRALVSDGHAKVHLNATKVDESNFKQLCKIIEGFERVSGAQLNPAKSVILPFALERPLQWLQQTGCQVLSQGQFITYLGCRFRIGKAGDERVRDLREKLQRRLSRWANRFLSWTSRVLLLQHVLRALPVYHFLGLGLPKNGFMQLEAPCRTFLWGTNQDNRPKTPLVRWDSVTKLKENGGLNIRPFQRVSDVLKMKYIGRILNGETTDWAEMARHFIRRQVQNKSYIREAKFWTAEECLLLLPSLSISCSETTNNMVQSWLRCRSCLRLQEQALALPGSFTLRQLRELLKRYSQAYPFNDKLVFPLLKRLGVRILANLLDGSGNWMRIVTAMETKGFCLDPIQHEAIATFQSSLSSVHIGPQKIEDSPSWALKGSDRKWTGWLLPSKTWHNLLTKDEAPDDLTGKWPLGIYRLTWMERWKKLWEAGGLLRIKTWLRKLLRRAFFTGERASRMQVSQDLCCRCRQVIETVSHLFFECHHSITRWHQLQESAQRVGTSFCATHNLLDSIDEALITKKKGSSFIYILSSLTTTIWKDRNEMLFRNKTQETPLRVSLEQARWEIEGSFNPSSSASRWWQGLHALTEINRLLEVSSNPTTTTESSERGYPEIEQTGSSIASNYSGIESRRRTPEREDQIKDTLNANSRTPASNSSMSPASNSDQGTRSETRNDGIPMVHQLPVAESNSWTPATSSEQDMRSETRNDSGPTVRLTNNDQSPADLPHSWNP
ncbi:hypothetical protein R1flu_001858 [Riccia fluitans]|uniref:Reverse transcriptase zinc-binding domain-containing protein n=1 Tax=Riccia fluitans TaxID=41844 RepID=A0ABD1Y4G1_9MARC